MQIYVSANVNVSGTGIKDAPYKTISEAAKAAKPGDEVIVAPGIYRECIDPICGGTGDVCRITYRSEIPLAAVITGAESVKSWERYSGDVWVARIPNEMFGQYNPYITTITGDWYFGGDAFHTGEVYLNGKAMYEVQSVDRVLNPVPQELSWDSAYSVHCWYTLQDGNNTVIYGNFQGKDPNNEDVEINVRQNCFFPSKKGINYITLSGFTVKQAATQWAPPTAFQDGMIGPHWSKGWIIEDCEISDSRCSGISLGKYLQPENDNKWTTTRMKDGAQTERECICRALNEGWTKENIGSHIIRRCNIHDCGQAGIVGHLGCAFSIIEYNHIHHINCRQDLAGAEIGGIKFHAAIDTIIRRNHIHHCTKGLWLDWQAQGTRVTQNLFHDNVPPVGSNLPPFAIVGEDLFIEVSHGPTLVDNNLLLSPSAARLSTQGVAFVHNLIAGAFTSVGTGTDNGAVNFPSPRYTPYHIPHRTEIAGFMTILHGDMRFFNNVFVQPEKRLDLFKCYEEKKAMGLTDFFAAPNTVVGTVPYSGYPTAKEYFDDLLTPASFGAFGSDKYFDHLPVCTGGNVFFNGAKPCDKEKNYVSDSEHVVVLKLRKENGKYSLDTNLYEHLPCFTTELISTENLGEAFEPEQKFENPDGTPIAFDLDYWGQPRTATPFAGPFEAKTVANRTLNWWQFEA